MEGNIDEGLKYGRLKYLVYTYTDFIFNAHTQHIYVLHTVTL